MQHVSLQGLACRNSKLLGYDQITRRSVDRNQFCSRRRKCIYTCVGTHLYYTQHQATTRSPSLHYILSTMSIRSLLSFGLLAAPLVSALPAADHKSTSCRTSTSTSHSTSHSSSHSSTQTSTHSSATSAVVTTTTSSASNTVMTTTLLATATGKTGLNDYAKKAGKLYFGTAADVPGTNETTDKYYRAELANRDDWGQVTPANAMK